MDAKPEFFCVFMPQINAVRMRLPDVFLATLSIDSIPKRAVLRNRLRKNFAVEVRVENGRVYFDGGWPEFVAGNRLKVGYVLVFSFDGLHRFDVKIFDHSGCEKDICKIDPVEDKIIKLENGSYVADDNGTDEKDSEDENKNKNDSYEESYTNSGAADFRDNNFKGRSGASVPCITTHARKNIENLHTPKGLVMVKKQGHEQRKPPGRLVAQHWQELRDKAVALFQPKNPYFAVDMKKQNVMKCKTLYVPRDFANKHLKKFTVQGTLLDPVKRKWPVTVYYNNFPSEMSLITTGWSEFVRRNSLQMKDICVFELVESNPLLLKVSIARKP